jgi:hypothetical protein
LGVEWDSRLFGSRARKGRWQNAVFDIPLHVDYLRRTMKIRLRTMAVVLAGMATVLCGCNWFGGINSKGAVQAAIEAHLKKRPGLALSNMSTEVQEVKFQGGKANAHVVFVSKDSPDLKVEVSYVLRREGDHWEVESSTPMGGVNGSPHGGVAVPPTGGMPPQTVPSSPSAAPSPQASH